MFNINLFCNFNSIFSVIEICNIAEILVCAIKIWRAPLPKYGSRFFHQGAFPCPQISSLKIIFDCFTPHVCVHILVIFHTKILKVFLLTCSIHFYGPYFRTSIFYIKTKSLWSFTSQSTMSNKGWVLGFFFHC